MDRPGLDRVSGRLQGATLALLAITAVALAARLHRLGARVFYYDEAWFGYWTLRFIENGVWEYRPILHGPFFVRVNSVVFPALGVDDATARLVVAGIGGLLPLSAWLFRDHLRRGEVVALGALLAVNPILLYYSRFMRKDLPLAAFMLVTLGLLLRAHATRRARYLYAAAITLGLAFATKESVLLWLVTGLGAGALVLDRHLLHARDVQGDATGALRSYAERAVAGLQRWWPHAVLALGLWLLVVVYFYAPRAGPGQQLGLWRALGGEYGTIPRVVGEATVGSLRKALEYWASGSIQDHPYLPYLADTLSTLATGALAVSVLAVVGFLYDRYVAADSRGLVAFGFYAGVAATLGYPIANNLPVPWSTIHSVVPLTIPAATGASVIYRWGRGQLADSRGPAHERRAVPPGWLRTAVAAVLLASLVVAAGATAVETSYRAPHESPRGADGGHEIVYYAQAPAELRAVVTAIETAATSGGPDTDVLYVGQRLAMNESAVDYPPATGAWHARMPLPWYTEALGADVASVRRPAAMGDDPPPVVITTPGHRDTVAGRLGDAYEGTRHPLDDIGDRTVVVFVRR